MRPFRTPRLALILVAFGWSAMQGTAVAQEAGEVAWLVEDADAVRFAGSNTAGPSFDQGTRVQVLFVEGDLKRVFAGNRFGWVAASALSATDPNAASDADAPASSPSEGFTVPTLKSPLSDD